jgi:hypothetical protein
VNDERIIELFFERSEEAISELDKKYGRVCHAVSYNILNDIRDAEECVNDSYLGTWNAIPPARPNPLITFVLKIVRNISLKRYEQNTALKRNSRYDASMEELPDKLEDLPKWLADTMTVGRKSFWYSMGGRLPKSITLEATSNITSEDGGMQFIKAEYKVLLDGNNGEKEESWVIYFMEENGVYSAFAVAANDDFDFVKSYTETIVKSYKQK